MPFGEVVQTLVTSQQNHWSHDILAVAKDIDIRTANVTSIRSHVTKCYLKVS